VKLYSNGVEDEDEDEYEYDFDDELNLRSEPGT
jgi:hypothetical protein